MEKKYYNPKIEEFHVGFEFEYLNVKNQWIKSDDFSDTFLNDDIDTVSEVGRYLDNSEIRVKFLDREDIESLGWNYSGINAFGYVTYSIFEKLSFGNVTSTLSTYIVDDTLTFLIRKTTELNKPIRTIDNNTFCGTIKNKSELQKLMNQLGIK